MNAFLRSMEGNGMTNERIESLTASELDQLSGQIFHAANFL